jgi:hypothetical protein
MNRVTTVSDLWQLPTAIALMFVGAILLWFNMHSSTTYYGSMSRSWAIEEYGWPIPMCGRDLYLDDETKTALNNRKVVSRSPIMWSPVGLIANLVIYFLTAKLTVRVLDRRESRAP